MDVRVCSSAEEVARVAADVVARECRAAGAEPVLGLATGSSPLGTYAELAAMVAAGDLDLSCAHGFALDEYVGLAPGHPESYVEVIDRTVTRPLRMDPRRVHVPDGAAADLVAECAAYEAMIRGVGG